MMTTCWYIVMIPRICILSLMIIIKIEIGLWVINREKLVRLPIREGICNSLMTLLCSVQRVFIRKVLLITIWEASNINLLVMSTVKKASMYIAETKSRALTSVVNTNFKVKAAKVNLTRELKTLWLLIKVACFIIK